MLKYLVLSLVVSASTTQAFAADVFSTYETVARRAVASFRAKEDTSRDLNELVQLGYRIMDLYVAKFAECRDQYAQVSADDAAMKAMSFDALEKKYHDGEGLVQAPSHCYQGRSMVVHPYMAMALVREKRDGFVHEVEEVQKRAPKLKARLDL